jgi:hypothetical protein
MLRRLLAVVVVCGTAAIGFTAATAVSATRTSSQAHVQVGFKVGKFVQQGHGLVALGSVTTQVTTPDGKSQTLSKPFRAQVVSRGFRTLASRTCAVLQLRLDKLYLNLLGLQVNLGKVVLSISASPTGGALGSLFCKLAHTQVKLRSLASYAGKLTKTVHAAGLATSDSLLGVSAPMTQKQLAAGTAVCPILDLILGPLHLDLLGLIVDLNQVHLTITADPHGGALGALFCQLAGSTTTTTAPTTT